MTDVKGLIERLRDDQGNSYGGLYCPTSSLVHDAADALELMQRERDEALGALAEALEIRAGFLAAADSEDWQEETQSSVVIMRDTASKLRALSPKEAAE